MSITFYTYPVCGTCKKAKKWLEENQVPFEEVHIVENTPSKEVIQSLYQNSGLNIKKFFNTSGMKYRELGLKDKIGDLSEEELFSLLASDGMLIKRPIVTNGDKITLGFKEAEFQEKWQN